jgi:hypothetical protein
VKADPSTSSMTGPTTGTTPTTPGYTWG